jgi:hypothetical protein
MPKQVPRAGATQMKDTFNVIVAGSRSFGNYALLKEKLDAILKEKKTTHQVQIISGGAAGADQLGEIYAKDHDLDLKLFPANWKLHGNKAGYIRNTEMARHAQAVVVFWDGKSSGTRHMIKTAHKLNLLTRVILFPLHR